MLFDGQADMQVSPRSAPRPVSVELQLTDAQWDGLFIPINMAFFFHSTPAGRIVALYPSPAGPMESTSAARRLGRDRRAATHPGGHASGR